MKKCDWMKLLTFSLFLLLVNIGFIEPIPSNEFADDTRSSGILHVGGSGPGNFTKIQDAVNNATNGDTILVYNGTYYENVLVNKSINLAGKNRNNTIIDGNEHDNVILISAYNVNITDLTLQHSGSNSNNAGIKMNNVQDCIVNRININNTVKGISLSFSANNSFSENIINNIDDGISVQSSCNNSFSEHTISNTTGFGIHLSSSRNNFLTDNNMKENGIMIFGINKSHYTSHSIDSSNCINEKPVYYWKNKNQGSILPNASQIILANCTNIKVENQNLNNGTMKIQISYSSNCSITNTTINNTVGGISLSSSANNSFSENIISNNTGFGIHLSSSCNNSFSENIFNNNTGYGIVLSTSCNNNFVYHNNFFNNTLNAYDKNNKNNNKWYHLSVQEGNYWYDYNGTDNNGDGIGDKPYNISGGKNQDEYPLIKPWNHTDNISPIADFNFTPNPPLVFKTISFIDESIDPDGTIINWSWNFDDGTISYQQHPTHQFTNTGPYLVCLQVTDNDKASDVICKELFLYSNVSGDMNNNGKLNSADIRYLALYLCGDPDYAPLYANGDVNSNGIVNSADVRYLALYLCGDPDYSPLYP